MCYHVCTYMSKFLISEEKNDILTFFQMRMLSLNGIDLHYAANLNGRYEHRKVMGML